MTSLEAGSHEPIAIVGMGCRWPGNVHNTSQFWEFLRDRVNGLKEFNTPRFSKAGFYHPDSNRPGSIGMKGAFLVEEDARLFDHAFFGMTALEVQTLDPSQRKLLEVVYEAIESAGDTWESVSGSNTGVFVGNFCLDHWMIQSRDWDYPRPYAFTGAGTSILANRVSYIFNLHGPSLTVDTACSSSMYALHLAMNSLRAGDCDSAIVASANWVADPGVQIALDKLGALSASARCHTFDIRAEGYARGEGYGAIYLKKVPVAVAHESPIRAIIRGTAINSNGRTGGITRPSASGQELVIRQAYQNAGGLPYSDTSYFECHGTGTYVGDPIEVAAVGRVFGPHRDAASPLLVGSVKSNIGHGEGASALASIMKVVLALEKGAIPPVYDLQTRNPNIDFDGAKVAPVTTITPWPKDRLQRASINSFGYGGANGHCIIDHVNVVLPNYAAPGVYYGLPRPSNSISNGISNGHTNGFRQRKTVAHHPIIETEKTICVPGVSTRQWVVLPFSAHNEASFKKNLKTLAQVSHRFSLADIAYTLGNKRSKLAQRSFCVVERDHVEHSLTMDRKLLRAPLQAAKLGFVFTGQGAQWHGMAVELLEYQVFRSTIEYLDFVLGALPNAPSWSLYSTVTGEQEDASFIQTAEVSQTLCTAVQVGLVDLLASWSVRPSGVVGHSSGEIAAAYAAGRITAAEAIVTAFVRGQAVAGNKRRGAMLAVGLGPKSIDKYVQGQEEQVRVAAINSPGSVTLSGDPKPVEDISALMTADGVFNRVLRTGGQAYHSHHMVAVGSKYLDMLDDGFRHIQDLGLVKPELRYQHVPWISSVTPAKSTTNFLHASSYWRANLQSPVRFSEALTGLIQNEDAGITALLEIGPHPALKSPVEQIVKAAEKSIAYTYTLKRQEDSRISMLQCAGTLFTLNAGIDFTIVNATDTAEGMQRGCTCKELPPYQYTYGDLNYYESRPSREYRYRPTLRHDILGSKLVGVAKLRPQWRNILRLKDVAWLGDHRLASDAVLPGAAYIAMAVEASLRIHDEVASTQKISGFCLEDVAIMQTLIVPEDDYGVEVMTCLDLVDTATPTAPAWAAFSVSSVGRETGEWTEHCTGRVKIQLDNKRGTGKRIHNTSHTLHPVDSRAWYSKFSEVGLNYGSVFQPLSDICVDTSANVAKAIVDLCPNSSQTEESRYAVHPASLDGAIQLGLIACNGGRTSEADTAFVPVKIANLYIAANLPQEACTVVAHGEKRGVRGANLELQMLGADGELLLHAESLRCISYSREVKPVDLTFSSPFTRLVWKPDISLLDNQQARSLYLPPEKNKAKVPQWGITNKIAHFVVFSIYAKLGKLKEVPKPSGDVGHFFEWIRRKGQNDHSEMMEEARNLDVQGLLIQELESLVKQAPDVMEVTIAKLLHDNWEDILYERRTGMEVIVDEGLLTPLYESGLLMTGIYPQLTEVISGIAHTNPNLRVLEIGGGTGGATRVAMQAFTHSNGIKLYNDYTFTDVSAGFLSGARSSFADYRDMSFSVLDMEIDPLEQGYEQTYDLVLACQVLHASSSMHKTLSHCRKLLRPGGKLVMVETTENFIVPGVVVGTFTGYWAGIPDGRIDAPFQGLPAWDESLQKAGFTGLDLVLDDFPEPHNTTSVIVSTARPHETIIPHESTVYMYYIGEEQPALMDCICNELTVRGITVQRDLYLDQLPSGSRAIVLYGDMDILINAGEDHLKAFQHVSSVASSLLVLTSGGIVKGHGADGAVLTGLLRVLQNENPGCQFASIDVDTMGFSLKAIELQNLARSVVDVNSRLSQDANRDNEQGHSDDREFSWHDGCMWVSRHVPDSGFHSKRGWDPRRSKPEQLPLSSQSDLRAAFETPGVVNSLYFTHTNDRLQPLARDFIDIKVQTWGLSAKDLDSWSGRSDSNYLSTEYAGIITAIGSDVTGFQVGDYVHGLGKGQFGTFARVPAAFASKLQASDSLLQMCSLPCAYATAVYALDHIAQIQQGQSVLVQAAACDVGIATIILAKAKGANVFAVTENSRQADFLAEQLILPASHIIPMFDIDQIAQVAATLRSGHFEVYLSTSPREEIVGEVLAPLGHIIDLSGNAANRLGQLLPNVSYSSVDIMAIFEADAAVGAKVTQAVAHYRRQGIALPIPGLTVIDVGSFSPASFDFANLAGKLVIDFGNSDSLVNQTTSPPAAIFDPEACYVITGGLGGLGQTMISWMINRGARHLALLSRRQVSDVPKAEKLIASFVAPEVDIQCFVCDITGKDQVDGIVQQIATVRPIKGIVHAAVSYLDLSFDKITASRWRAGLSAKVQGTKNLHEASLSLPLDFFVMTTSALSLYAFSTQGAYTASNNFQDAFARYRQNLGLPASTISFSLVQEVTKVGTDTITVNLFERNETVTIGQYQFLTMLEPAFLNNRTADEQQSIPWTGLAQDPLSAANLHTYLDPPALVARQRESLEGDGPQSKMKPRWHSDSRVSHMMRAVRDAQKQAGQLQGSEEGSKNTPAQLRASFDATLQEGPESRTSAMAFAQESIVDAVASMLYVDAQDVDANKSVADLGVDSLIAAELRNWFLQALGANISMLDLLDPAMSIVSRATAIVDTALQAVKA